MKLFTKSNLLQKSDYRVLQTNKIDRGEIVGQLASSILDEAECFKIAQFINQCEAPIEFLQDIFEEIHLNDFRYDWNVGGIVKYIKVSILISAITTFTIQKYLYNSIGLCWALSEISTKDQRIIKFLINVINETDNSEAWWRAAFSLEELGVDKAVNILKRSLKASKLQTLEEYINNLNDKKSIIGILMTSNSDNIENYIYPELKKLLLTSKNSLLLQNVCWLIGRFGLLDEDIIVQFKLLLNGSDNEVRYNILLAIQFSDRTEFNEILKKIIANENNHMIKKQAIKALSLDNSFRNIEFLEDILIKEESPEIIAEISKGIYNLSNREILERKCILKKSQKNENGLIADNTDKWYQDAGLYNIFSEAEDPENLCFQLIKRKLVDERFEIINPIDLATGSGRTLRNIIQYLNYTGKIIGLDASQSMCNFLRQDIKRSRLFTAKTEIIASTILDMPNLLGKLKSTFIISSFGFPSGFSDNERCIQELQAVSKILDDDGIFITIGWDETFNDELNEMWYQFVPDNIKAFDFEEWRKKRASKFTSPRNCGLTWFKRNIRVPLQFSNLEESAYIMGHLFGRDAASYVIERQKTSWEMSYGITYNSKDDILNILKRYYEKRN